MTAPYITERAGKQYVYRSTSTYSAEKRGPVAQVEYMGRVVDGRLVPKRGYSYDESTGAFERIAEAVAAARPAAVIRSKRFGDAYLLDALQRRLGILEDLIASFGDRPGRMLMAVAFAYTIRPGALMHMEGVIEKRCIPELLGLPLDTDFSSQRMSELTRSVGADRAGLDAFFERRITGSEGQLIFDLTSESSYSAADTGAEWGRNKDRVPLRRPNLGLVTDREGRPQMFYIYPGSTADVATAAGMVEDVKRLGGGDATLILDRGFISPGSICRLLLENMDFVSPIRIDRSDVMKSSVRLLLDSAGDVDRTVVCDGRSYRVVSRSVGVRRMRGAKHESRETLWEDPDGYDLLLEGDPEYGSCEGYVDLFLFKDVAAAGYEVSEMDVALESIRGRLDGSRPGNPRKHVESVAGRYASMIDWVLDGDGALKTSVKQNAHTFAANRKGVFAMITPGGRGRDPKWILETYGWRDSIEDVFLIDKSEGDGRTPRSGDRDAINGRTLIRLVSAMMTVEIIRRRNEVADDGGMDQTRKPRDVGKRTPGMLLDSLSNIETIYGDGWQRMTEVTRDNRLIFDMFTVGPPKEAKPW